MSQVKTAAAVAERLWRASDVAEYGSCSISWVYKEAERGTLPCIRVGAMRRFDPAAIKAFFSARAVPVAP